MIFRGFVLIIVNVASKCGYTSKHYKELVELDEKYREKGLRILGFPCNQFGGQVNVLVYYNNNKEFILSFKFVFSLITIFIIFI